MELMIPNFKRQKTQMPFQALRPFQDSVVFPITFLESFSRCHQPQEKNLPILSPIAPAHEWLEGISWAPGTRHPSGSIRKDLGLRPPSLLCSANPCMGCRCQQQACFKHTLQKELNLSCSCILNLSLQHLFTSFP